MFKLINTEKVKNFRIVFPFSNLYFILLCALFFTVAQNLAFWNKTISIVDFNNFEGLLFFVSIFVFLFCAISIIFLILLWRPFLKPVLIILLLFSSIANYFGLFFGTYIDKSMIMNVFETHSGEVTTLITPVLLLWLTFFWLIPSLLVLSVKFTYISDWKKNILLRIAILLSTVVVLLLVSLPIYKQYAFFVRNNQSVIRLITPGNYLSGLVGYAKYRYAKNRPLVLIGQDAKQILPVSEQQKKKSILVVVLGETSRAKNFSLNDYNKNTNPLLSGQQNLVNFQTTKACGTATAISVPCMFSNMARGKYSAAKAESQENLLDILKRAGVGILWRENDGGCKGVCDRVTTEQVRDYVKDKSQCPEGLCYDEHTLSNLEEYFKQQPQDMVIVLHTNGSHGPSYYNRFPEKFKQFQPMCQTGQVQGCSSEELVNVYDNTILHVDSLLNQTIELLKKQEDEYETAMIYVSDHGESLGENGIYLHGTPYVFAPEEQTNIPMLFWASEGFLKKRSIDLSCMKQRGQTEQFSHDNLFHSVLGLMYVQTTEYDSEFDMFKSCQL